MKMKLSQITISFFVRVKLDQSRVEFFYQRLVAGEELEPVEVDPQTNELIDGRHRMAAYEKFGSDEINVRHKRYASTEERIAAALRANTGGPLPSSPQDIDHVIGYLMGINMSQKRIIELVATSLGVSTQFVKNAVKKVLHNLRQINVRKAMKLVADGSHSMEQAAITEGVTVDEIKTAAGLGKKLNRPVIDIGLGLKTQVKTLSMSIGAKLNHVQSMVKGGEITSDEALAIIGEIEKPLKNLVRNNADWKKRILQAAVIPVVADRLGKDRSRKKIVALTKKAVESTGKSALEKMELD